MVVPAMTAVRFLVPLEGDDEGERAVGILEVIWIGKRRHGWEIDPTRTYGARNTIRNGSDCGKRV